MNKVWNNEANKAKDAWCKVGAIAKTADGDIGVVIFIQAEARYVRLRFADGSPSHHVSPGDLTQATASEAAGVEWQQMVPEQVALPEGWLTGHLAPADHLDHGEGQTYYYPAHGMGKYQ